MGTCTRRKMMKQNEMRWAKTIWWGILCTGALTRPSQTIARHRAWTVLVVTSLLVTNVSNQVLRPSGLTCTSRRERKGHAQLNDKPCKGLNDNDYDAAYNKGAKATDKWRGTITITMGKANDYDWWASWKPKMSCNESGLTLLPLAGMWASSSTESRRNKPTKAKSIMNGG